MDDRPHTGRMPKVDRAVMKKIRKNAYKKIIWTGKERQDAFENTGTKYHITYVVCLLRKCGYARKVPVRMHANRATCRRDPYVPKRDCRRHKKTMKKSLQYRTNP